MVERARAREDDESASSCQGRRPHTGASLLARARAPLRQNSIHPIRQEKTTDSLDVGRGRDGRAHGSRAASGRRRRRRVRRLHFRRGGDDGDARACCQRPADACNRASHVRHAAGMWNVVRVGGKAAEKKMLGPRCSLFLRLCEHEQANASIAFIFRPPVGRGRQRGARTRDSSPTSRTA